MKYEEESALLYPSRRLRQWTKPKETKAYSGSKSVRQALMFLIHFIGDVHQPLHVSRASDKGGNDISIKYHPVDRTNTKYVGEKGRPENLTEQHSDIHYVAHNIHSVWDTAMIRTALERDYSNDAKSHPQFQMEASLESLLANHTEWFERFTRCQKGSGARHLECVIEWGRESWSRALKYAYTKNSPWENDADGVIEVAPGDVIDDAYYSSRIPVVEEQLIAAAVRLSATLEDIFGLQYETGHGSYSKHATIQLTRWTESIRTWALISQSR